MRSLIVAGLLFCAGCPAAIAADENGLNVLRNQLGGSQTNIATMRQQALERFRRTDVDGVPGVSQADYDVAVQLASAMQRGQAVAASFMHDLDGDGRVTLAEVRLAFMRQAHQPLRSGGATVQPTEEQVRIILEKLVATAFEADANQDGVLTFEEVYAHAEAKRKPQFVRHFTQQTAVPLSLDANGDGTVSAAEYQAAVDIVLRELDPDGDGTISHAEQEANRTRLASIRRVLDEQRQRAERQARLAEHVKLCRMPPVPQGARVMAVGTRSGAAISSVTIGEADAEIRVARIDIQEGEQPLYVIARSGTGTIWQFTGAVQRVAHVVAMSEIMASDVPRVGIVGIDRTRVTFKSAKTCLLDFSAPSHIEETRQHLTALLEGTTPEVIAALSPLSRVRFPIGIASGDYPIGRVAPQPNDRGSRAVYDEMIRRAPLGVVEIDPKTVVSGLPVKTFDVLPGYAGLLQLIEMRALEVTEYVRALRLGRNLVIGDLQVTDPRGNAATVTEVAQGFRVLGRMTMPTHLEHSLKFVVPAGVPVPLGAPGPAKLSCESGAALPRAGEPCP